MPLDAEHPAPAALSPVTFKRTRSLKSHSSLFSFESPRLDPVSNLFYRMLCCAETNL